MKRCLIIDDSRVIRRVAAKILEDLGFAVEEAENGKSALKICRTRMPDIVFVDSDMPDMDGMACLRAMREMSGGDKVVALICSLDGGVCALEAALDSGADECIVKPFDGEIIRSKLQLLELLS